MLLLSNNDKLVLIGFVVISLTRPYLSIVIVGTLILLPNVPIFVTIFSNSKGNVIIFSSPLNEILPDMLPLILRFNLFSNLVALPLMLPIKFLARTFPKILLFVIKSLP